MRTPFLVAFLTALLLHLGGLAVVAFFWRALDVAPLHFPPLIARVIPVEPPPEPVLPPTLAPPAPAPIIPPTPMEPVDLEPSVPPIKPTPPAKPVRPKKPAPARAIERPPGPPAATAGASPAQELPPGPPLPQPETHPAAAEGNVVGPVRSQTTPLPPVEGGEAGAGRLFDRGNVAVVPGPGIGGGSGGPGHTGLGLGPAGSGAKAGGVRPGGGGSGSGSSGAVRPLGGYQVKPRYPELARRLGLEGTVLLKVRVTEQGRVETVQVERSAGHPTLDQSATDAVQRWRFEPARQGRVPVAVWVLIPVEFKLEY